MDPSKYREKFGQPLICSGNSGLEGQQQGQGLVDVRPAGGCQALALKGLLRLEKMQCYLTGTPEQDTIRIGLNCPTITINKHYGPKLIIYFKEH